MYDNFRGKWVADLGDGNYKNPILFADYSDPDVIRVGDDFFMVASSFTYFQGLPVLHSKDLVNWRVISYAVSRLPFDAYDVPMHGKGVWAPSIRFHDGWFWVFVATPDEGLFMTKSKDPFTGWEDVHLVKEAKGFIDPCPFWDDDGSAYVVHAFAKSRCGVKSILHINKMSPDGRELLDEGRLVFDGRINHPTIEGPKLYKRNGMYYIFAPAGGVTCGWQTVLRSENIYGPYEHRVVMQQGDSPINGPHQGGFVELENGDCFFIHFQDAGGYGRITHLQPMEWISDWPVIGVYNKKYKTGEPVLKYKKPVDMGVEEAVTPQTDDSFNGEKLGLQWQWQAHGNESFYDLSGGRLRLFSKKIPIGEGLLCDAPNLLTQLIQSPSFSAVTCLTHSLTTHGDAAGICVTGGNYYSLRLQNINGKLFIKTAYFEYKDENTVMEEIAESEKEFSGVGKIFLKLVLTYDMNISFYYSLDGLEYFAIGETRKYTVDRRSWVGGRVGLFCVNTAQNDTNGYADFEKIEFGD